MNTFKKILLIITLITVFCSLGFKINASYLKEFLFFQIISSINSPQKTQAKILLLKNQQKTPESYFEHLSQLDSLNVREIRKYLQTGYAVLDTMHFPDSLIISLINKHTKHDK